MTKKGTGKAAKVKKELYTKFVEGCVEKGLSKKQADELWEKFEFFSGYGFNKSHAVSYSMISYQCAWLLNYYPECWMAAFLDKEPETRKAKAITIAKKYGFDIAKLNPGEYTLPLVYNSQQGKQGYRILFLKSETEPHIASLKTDYSKIQAVALSEKKETALKNWLERKVKKTYIYIGDEYNCTLLDIWIQSPITQK